MRQHPQKPRGGPGHCHLTRPHSDMGQLGVGMNFSEGLLSGFHLGIGVLGASGTHRHDGKERRIPSGTRRPLCVQSRLEPGLPSGKLGLP